MEKIKIGGEDIVVGHMIRVKCVKNKTFAPFRKAKYLAY
jgi:RecA/RadA recombinase